MSSKSSSKFTSPRSKAVSGGVKSTKSPANRKTVAETPVSPPTENHNRNQATDVDEQEAHQLMEEDDPPPETELAPTQAEQEEQFAQEENIMQQEDGAYEEQQTEEQQQYDQEDEQQQQQFEQDEQQYEQEDDEQPSHEMTAEDQEIDSEEPQPAMDNDEDQQVYDGEPQHDAYNDEAVYDEAPVDEGDGDFLAEGEPQPEEANLSERFQTLQDEVEQKYDEYGQLILQEDELVEDAGVVDNPDQPQQDDDQWQTEPEPEFEPESDHGHEDQHEHEHEAEQNEDVQQHQEQEYEQGEQNVDDDQHQQPNDQYDDQQPIESDPNLSVDETNPAAADNESAAQLQDQLRLYSTSILEIFTRYAQLSASDPSTEPTFIDAANFFTFCCDYSLVPQDDTNVDQSNYILSRSIVDDIFASVADTNGSLDLAAFTNALVEIVRVIAANKDGAAASFVDEMNEFFSESLGLYTVEPEET